MDKKLIQYGTKYIPERLFLIRSKFNHCDTNTYLYRRYLDVRVELMKDIRKGNEIKWKLILTDKQIQDFDKEIEDINTELVKLDMRCYPNEPDDFLTNNPAKIYDKFY